MIDVAAAKTPSGGSDPRPLPRYHILVVDDERPIRDIVCKVLAAEGHTVEGCADGEAALRLLESRPYDLLVLDFNMPIKTGADVILELRARGSTVPVLFTSCQTPEELERLSNGASRIHYLPKPFTLEDLRTAVLQAAAA